MAETRVYNLKGKGVPVHEMGPMSTDFLQHQVQFHRFGERPS